MDLTPKAFTPWWSLFGCCRPPAASPSSSDGEEKITVRVGETNTTAPTVSSTKLEVVTGGKVVAAGESDLPDTPSTACTDYSDDVSFASLEDDFIGEIYVSTPRYEMDYNGQKINENFAREARTSDEMTVSLGGSTKEEEKDFDDETSHPDAADCWYARLSSLDGHQSPTKRRDTEQIGRTVSNVQDAVSPEIKFYQFVALMMLHYMFGSWMIRLLIDQTENSFNAQFLLTQHGDSEVKKSETNDKSGGDVTG
eukprot:CAMPEP_0172529772 /NCGR_PEP_ID=MMETSP1067-20121228/3768_1 /TAXON_ID=265564 ORGANISM="Thalassiosira punctigera, Strain Tpunct2005C2" /NCGR_SAMPLE_ID=MMETSP1067 /ASSEMBLY_ACC=CAM_ASM_000444 /LENGTH=252 /DNA_ID=CAMNT_0013313893 /DNA_START=164 /DNA_END=922 /DNA_ORIENTATION=-